MFEIYFYNYSWQNIFLFLLGPLALLLFIYANFEKKLKKISLYLISITFFLIFVLTAKKIDLYPVNWYENKKFFPEKIEEVIQSNSQSKPVFLYFSADWCSSCKDLEQKIKRKEVSELLNYGWINLQIDVTNYEEYKELLLKEYNVYGVPAISFIDKEGNKLKTLTMVGSEIPLNTLISILKQFGEFDQNHK